MIIKEATRTDEDTHLLENSWPQGHKRCIQGLAFKPVFLATAIPEKGTSQIEALNPGSQARHRQQRRDVDCRIIAAMRRLRLEVCPNMGKDKVKIFIKKYNRTIQEELIDLNEVLLEDPNIFNPKRMNDLLWYNTKRPHWSLKLQSPVNSMLTTHTLSRMRWTDTKN